MTIFSNIFSENNYHFISIIDVIVLLYYVIWKPANDSM